MNVYAPIREKLNTSTLTEFETSLTIVLDDIKCRCIPFPMLKSSEIYFFEHDQNKFGWKDFSRYLYNLLFAKDFNQILEDRIEMWKMNFSLK